MELIVSDEHEGLKAAVARHFQGGFPSEVSGALREDPPRDGGAKKRKELGADLRGIFAAPDKRSALDLASSVAQKWRDKGHEKVAYHVEEHIEECLLDPSSINDIGPLREAVPST